MPDVAGPAEAAHAGDRLAAAALDVSPRTAGCNRAYARAWLVTALRDEG